MCVSAGRNLGLKTAKPACIVTLPYARGAGAACHRAALLAFNMGKSIRLERMIFTDESKHQGKFRAPSDTSSRSVGGRVGGCASTNRIGYRVRGLKAQFQWPGGTRMPGLRPARQKFNH